MSDDLSELDMARLVAHLRAQEFPGTQLVAWPGDLTPDECVAFMELANPDGVGIVLSIDVDFARRAIALGSLEEALK